MIKPYLYELKQVMLEDILCCSSSKRAYADQQFVIMEMGGYENLRM